VLWDGALDSSNYCGRPLNSFILKSLLPGFGLTLDLHHVWRGYWAVSVDPDLSGIRKDQQYLAMFSQIECQQLMY
jgi:hypothetical protein